MDNYGAVYTSGGVRAVAPGGAVFSFRNGGPRTAEIQCVTMSAHEVITVGPAGASLLQFELVVARNFTASDSGGIWSAPSGNLWKKDTSSPTSAIAELRIASDGALTPGTRTLDVYGMGSIMAAVPPLVPIGATIIPFGSMLFEAGDSAPIVLAPNEGFIIRATLGFYSWVTPILTVTTQWYEE